MTELGFEGLLCEAGMFGAGINSKQLMSELRVSSIELSKLSSRQLAAIVGGLLLRPEVAQQLHSLGSYCTSYRRQVSR